MKAQLAKVLRSEFQAWMKARFPNFQKVGTELGGLIYRKQIARKRYVFCFLCLSPKMDRFTVELAASDREKYPFEVLPGTGNKPGATRVRINSLINAGDHGWWNANCSHVPHLQTVIDTNRPEELAKAEARIPSLVADAVEQLAKVLPSFIETSNS